MHYPIIDPVVVSFGPIAVRWYGLAYLAGFLLAWGLGTWRARRSGGAWSTADVSDLVFYGALGAVLGGRIGYVLFYGLEQLSRDPLWLFRIWEGGMSFHGGLLGVIIGLWWFAQQREQSFLAVTDFVAPLVPIGLGLGRIANFINVELPGRAMEAGWGLIYPCAADAIQRINPTCVGEWERFARHPSPLYQAFSEGVVLFALLWFFARRPRRAGAVSAVFLIGYGVLRFITELFREPDPHLGFLMGYLTMGQLLSLPMALFGIFFLLWRPRRADAA